MIASLPESGYRSLPVRLLSTLLIIALLAIVAIRVFWEGEHVTPVELLPQASVSLLMAGNLFPRQSVWARYVLPAVSAAALVGFVIVRLLR